MVQKFRTEQAPTRVFRSEFEPIQLNSMVQLLEHLHQSGLKSFPGVAYYTCRVHDDGRAEFYVRYPVELMDRNPDRRRQHSDARAEQYSG